jgi:SNF2 family DNA or RNA helicase
LTIQVDKQARRIVIQSDEPLPGLKTTIPGAYQTVAGNWTVPLSLESCKLLREKYGKRLVIGSELRRWATGVVESRAYMAELAQAEDAELELLPAVAPKLHAAMDIRTYQRVGVRFVADNTATLIADDPGLGKTLIAMGGILEAGIPGPYLIVCPKTASDTVWRREILRWLPEGHKPITMPQFRAQREKRIRLTRYGPRTWLIINPEMVQVASFWVCDQMDGDEEPCGVRTPIGGRQQTELKCGHVRHKKTPEVRETNFPKLFQIQWGAVIVDESHESLIRRKGVATQRRRGLDMLQLRGDGMKLALSGTPFDSKPHQLWGTLNWLDPALYPAFHRWAELYWRKGGYTGHQLGEFIAEREHLLWDSMSAIALRRTKAEVAPDLPAKTYVGAPLSQDPDSPIGVWLEMDGPQAQAYHQMEKYSIAQLESGDLSALIALEELMRLKQMACSHGDIETREAWLTDEYGERYRGLKDFYVPRLPSNKFNWVIESLEEWGYPKSPIDKVVIVSFYTGILDVFRAGIEHHFKTKPDRPLCTAITGRTPMALRRQVIDQFNAPGGPQVMLLNLKAGGTAITIDSASRMIFLSETRIPDQQQQAEDRIHRISNPRPVMYYYLRSLDTVDVGTALINQEAIRDTHRLLDGRRGVAYTRRVLELSKAV